MHCKTKKFGKFRKKIVDFKSYWSIDHSKAFPGVMWGPTQNLGPIGSAVLTFNRNKQTNKHPDRYRWPGHDKIMLRLLRNK